MDFSHILLCWYSENKRDLPWRTTLNPYYIWISEIILQQTKVDQGLGYYNRFVEEFPDVFSLANASEVHVLKLWQGLGYYSRARNLHHTAKVIVEKYNGCFPSAYKELVLLKGIGPYTAAAIASIAFGEKIAVVDGNVYRVLSRYFGVFEDISLSKSRLMFQKLANSLILEVDAAMFNQAIMDFGALQCTPKKTNCEVCPLQLSCFAFRNHSVEKLPVKSKKTKITKRYLNYFIVRDKLDKISVFIRDKKDIWQGLYEFNILDTLQETSNQQLVEFVKSNFGENCHFEELHDGVIKHKLSHQELYIRFFECKLDEVVENAVTEVELCKLPFPIVIWDFLQEYLKK